MGDARGNRDVSTSPHVPLRMLSARCEAGEPHVLWFIPICLRSRHMSPFRFDLLVLAVAVAGAAIAGIYLLMLAVPQNDDEHLHDGISPPGHVKTHLLRNLARLRRMFTR